MPVTVFTSSLTGAPTLSATAGELVNLLDQVMILGRGLSFNGNTSGFIDNSQALRFRGAGVDLFPQPASGDIIYFGGCQQFAQIILNLTQVGVGGSYVFEYWNGSAWTALISSTDGTSGLTASGTVAWTIANQTGWVTTAVNSVTMYWVRIRCTSTPSQSPQANLGSIYGWGSPYQGLGPTGGNGRVYRSELTSGVQHYYNINDNAPATANEARIFAAEAMTQFNASPTGGTGITGPFPSVAQFANGQFIRKGAGANPNATVRTWQVIMDEKTVYLFVLTGDIANTYFTAGFGEFYSLVPGDLYRSFVAARGTESSTSGTVVEKLFVRLALINNGSSSSQGTYVPRPYTGSGSSQLVTLTAGLPMAWFAGAGTGIVPTFNGPDGGVVLGPIFLLEPTNQMRGRLRGIYDSGHAAAAFSDADTFIGSGLISTKAFKALKILAYADQNGNGTSAPVLMETSNTWETN